MHVLNDISFLKHRSPSCHSVEFAGATQYKCAPPIRTRANRGDLHRGIADGTIDLIGSDHSPAPPGMKETESGNFLKAWGGISGATEGNRYQYQIPLKAAGSTPNMTTLICHDTA